MDKKFVLKVFVIILFSVVGSYCIYYMPIRENYDLSKMDLERYNNLMIVAHPDDEMLWGGAHLIEDDYLIVCITCGTKRERLNEFKSVVKETDDSYIALGYQNKIRGERSDWSNCYDDIKNDINMIIDSNDWNLVVTHNEKGEYGHIHHIMVNKMVTDLYNENNYQFDLYHFGTYYSKKNIYKLELVQSPISDALLKRKEELLDLYGTQSEVIKNLSHMNKYEVWQKYSGD